MTHAPLPGNSDVVVLIPMYNEAHVVGDVLSEVQAHFSNVVVIDDGSSDDSAYIARAAGVRLVQHGVNLGAGAALATGLAYALAATKADYIVTFDADGQHRIENAVTMVDLLRGGDVEVALGSRFLEIESDIPTGRRWLLRAAVLWTRLTTGLPLTDTHNGLRAFTRHAASMLDVRLPGMAHGSEVLNAIAKHKLPYREVPVAVTYTDYTLRKGQRGVNAINILYDLAVAKVRLAR